MVDELILGMLIGLVVGLLAGAAGSVLVAERRRQGRRGAADAPTVGDDALHARLDDVSRELRDELERVGRLVDTMRHSSAQSFGSVAAQLQVTAQRTRELHDTTAELRNVLAHPKLRGQWGERMADDVLRLAGMREHVNYRKQRAVAGGTGIPDITFLLPKGQVLYLDVKFPLDAYVRHVQADTVAEADAQRSRFLRDVRAKVRELAARHYASAGRNALQPVLLFIPNEAIFQFVFEHDPALVDEALHADVVLCSPLTLFSLLAVIRQATDMFVTEQTSEEVLRLFGAFHEQWQRFGAHLDKLGDRLDTARRAYDELNGVRRRQLERPLDRIDDLRREHGLAADPLTAPGAEVMTLPAEEGA